MCLWRSRLATGLRKIAAARSAFEPAPQTGLDPRPGTVRLGDITLGDLPASALIEGFRINPRFESQVFGFDSAGERPVRGREFLRRSSAGGAADNGTVFSSR